MPFAGVAVRLEHMREAILDIETFVADKTFEDYLRERLLRRGVERLIEIISEASRHIPEGLKQRYPAVRWRSIAGIGNILRHDYDLVDDHEIWEVTARHVTTLHAAVGQMLREIEPDDQA